MKRKVMSIINQVITNLFFIVCCFIALLPVLYAFSVSVNAKNSLVGADFSFIPKEFTFINYVKLFQDEPLLLWFKNSIILSVSTLVIALGVSIPAAYIFSRRRFPGRKIILYILLVLNAFPTVLSMYAIYRLLRPLGLIDTKLGLIIVYIGTMAIFGLWNMKGYFDTIPVQIEEAAQIDGATSRQIVTRIVLPLAKPSIVVTAVMILIFVWNEYIYAVTFMTGAENYTLASGLYSLQATETAGNWPIFSAASLLISMPILIIFLIAQKNMVSGLTVGGIKG